MTNRIVIVTTTFPETFGGRTKSLLQRARVFSARGLKVELVSTNHNDNYQDIFESYRARGLIDSDTRIRNMFEDMAGFSNPTPPNVSQLLSNPKHSRKTVANIEDLVNALAIGEFPKPADVAYVDSSKTTVKHIDYLMKDGAVARAIVNKRQYVTRLKHSGRRFTSDSVIDYFDRNLRPFLRLRANGKKKEFSHIDRLGSAGPFVSYKRLISRYFDCIFCDDDIVICDARGIDYSLRLARSPARKIYVMHNPHLADPLRLDSGIKPSFRTILREEGLNRNETVVALTQDQRSSVLQYFPAMASHISVIGHIGPEVRLSTRRAPPPKRIGIIGRLDAQKNLSDAVRAFGLFLQKCPGYILDIYGKGSEEFSLRSLVSALGLDGSIEFHGFTNDVDEAFQSVAMTLNTSLHEGFPLAIIESIANGTPVASYPVNFGPKAILGEVAGRVSKERTPASLATEMLALVRTPLDRQAVQARAREFSEEDFFEKWMRMMAD